MINIQNLYSGINVQHGKRVVDGGVLRRARQLSPFARNVNRIHQLTQTNNLFTPQLNSHLLGMITSLDSKYLEVDLGNFLYAMRVLTNGNDISLEISRQLRIGGELVVLFRSGNNVGGYFKNEDRPIGIPIAQPRSILINPKELEFLSSSIVNNLQKATQSADPFIRRTASRILEQFRESIFQRRIDLRNTLFSSATTEMVPFLIYMLTLPELDQTDRIEIAEILMRLRVNQGRDFLIANFRDFLIANFDSEGFGIRTPVAEVFGKVGDLLSIEPLQSALQDRDVSVRKTAIEALGYSGDPAARGILLALLNGIDDPLDFQIRVAAIKSLNRFTTITDEALLLAQLENENCLVRLAAAESLEENFGHFGIARNTALTILKSFMKNYDSMNRAYESMSRTLNAIEAVKVLGKFGNYNDYYFLSFSKLFTDSSSFKKLLEEAAIKAMGEIGIPSASETVLSILRDPNKDINIRTIALETLVKIMDEESISKLLNDEKVDQSLLSLVLAKATLFNQLIETLQSINDTNTRSAIKSSQQELEDGLIEDLWH